MLVLANNIVYNDLQVIAYRDDTLFYKFYPLPEVPRIRKNRKGRPVFLLTKYAFSDQDREADPDLPTGGGYLNLDVVFALTPEQEAEVRQRLQQLVEDEWNRRRGIDATDEDYRYTGPEVELAAPQWMDGAVKFHVVNDPNLVKGKLSEGKPSMFGANNAIFNATLTPAGATYFQRTLVNPDGGGIDLTPVQVEYELSFMRRLPPARILIYGSVREIYHAVSELVHDYEDNFWSEDDFSTNESYSEYLDRSEAVTIRIDTGEYAADSDEIEELRNFAMGQLTKWLQESIFDRVTQFDPTYPDVADVYSKESDVYRLKKIDQVASSRLYINITQTGLVEHTIHPQATLESFFSGMTPEQIAQHVREVDLEDDFFKTLSLNVKAFADYSEVTYVKVDIDYAGEIKSFTFNNDDDAPGSWDPRLRDGNREYRYRYEVAFKSNPNATLSTGWQTEKTRELNINVGRPGQLALDVLAGQVDWENLIEQVQVTVSYEDRRNDIDKESTTLILKKDGPSAGYNRWLYKPQEEPVRWQAKYFLKSGQEMESDRMTTTDRQIVINDTFVDILQVVVVPAGQVEAVNQAIVDLRYQDSSGYRATKTFSISRPDFFAVWKVPLISPNQRGWEWRRIALYKDGTHDESGWEQMDGSQTLAVSWESPPYLNVSVNPVLVKFDRAPVVEVTLTYKGRVVEGESPATFLFEEKKKQTWTLRVEDDSITDYDWEVTYYTEPESVIRKGASNKRTFLVPRTPAPQG